jgi:hypothetical protein
MSGLVGGTGGVAVMTVGLEATGGGEGGITVEGSGGILEVLSSWTGGTTRGSDYPVFSEPAPMLSVSGSASLSGGGIESAHHGDHHCSWSCSPHLSRAYR